MDIRKILGERILVLDGAMGTMIQRHKLKEDDFRPERLKDHSHPLQGNNDLLSISQPEIIKGVHRAYLEAGADIIETNTFSSTSIAQADYALEDWVYELNFESAKIAKEVTAEFNAADPDQPRFVAGSIGPTNRTASLSPDVNRPEFRNVSFDELKDAYYEQVKGLAEGGVDILLVETVFDTLNCKAALFAIAEYFKDSVKELPIMVSGTITDASGRTLSGQTAEAFLLSISHLPLLSVGFNCALGAEELRPYLEVLSDKTDFFVSAHPNAGLPNAFGEYDQTSGEMGGFIQDFIQSGFINIIGGCCGTTPDHIQRIAEIAAKHQPRKKNVANVLPNYSGLEPLIIRENSNFVNVGERTNVTGSAKFRRLIKEGDFEEALSVALQQVEGGAQIIDVNMDEGMLDSEEAMVTFLNLIASEPDIARVPIMIDSSKWTVIEAGLKCVQGKSIVNSISLKEGEENFLEQARLIKQYGAAVIVQNTMIQTFSTLNRGNWTKSSGLAPDRSIQRIKDDLPYSSTLEIDSIMNLGFKRVIFTSDFLNQSSDKGFMVMSIEDESERYDYFSIPIRKSKYWQTLDHEIVLKDYPASARIKFYLWNSSKEPIYINYLKANTVERDLSL